MLLLQPLDLYHAPDVITSGVLRLGTVELKEGTHHLTIRITGANPSAEFNSSIVP